MTWLDQIEGGIRPVDTMQYHADVVIFKTSKDNVPTYHTVKINPWTCATSD